MNRGLLLGREHHKLGSIEVTGDGRTALAISMGGAKKSYSHTDPNEDAAGYLRSEHGVLLVAADGHAGHQAAEVAVQTLLDRRGAAWTGPAPPTATGWRDEALAALAEISETILLEASAGGERAPRTTLVAAVARPAADLLLVVSIGDSHVFKARPDGSADLTAWADSDAGPHFLGRQRETPESLGEKCFTTAEPLGATLALVLATDGLSEFAIGVEDPEASVTDAVARGATMPREERAPTAARELAALACEAHRRNPSGDNIATAVAWLDPGS